MGKYLSRKNRFINWDRKRDTENAYRTGGDGGESEIEELIHARKEDSPNKTDNPSTEGRRRHRGIICVGNRRTDFWIWGLIL